MLKNQVEAIAIIESKISALLTLNHNLSKIALSRQFYDDDLENLEEFQKDKMKEFEETPFESDSHPPISGSVKSMIDGLSPVDKTTIEKKVE